MLGLAGVTEMEDRVAEFSVTVVLPEVLPELAVIVAVPAARTVASPVLPTVVTAVFEEDQVTSGVISKLVPSE
jgi:hypothetical protein